MSIRLFLAVAVLICLPTLLHAQYPGQYPDQYRRNPYGGRQQQQMGTQPVKIQGTIQGATRGGVIGVLDTNTQIAWRVAIMPQTKVQVTGTTTVDSLRSGLAVEFTAEVDSHGAITEKVEELTITTVGQQKQMGCFPANELGAGDGQGGDKGGDAGDKGAKRPVHPRGKAAGATTIAGKYRIVGKLIVGRGGALSVQPGRGAVPFALADEATIKVDMSDFSAVRPGYEVSISGMMMPNRPGIAQAIDVKVTLPEPQGGPKKKPAAKPKAPEK